MRVARVFVFVLLSVLLPVLSPTANGVFGQDVPAISAVNALKGIKGIIVIVEDLDSNATALGLDTNTIRTDVELKLRLAGISIVPKPTAESSPASKVQAALTPFIDVQVVVLGGTVVVRVNVSQGVKVLQNGCMTVAATWDKVNIGLNPTADGIRGAIKDDVDAFLNDWLSVNPKK